MTKRKDPNTLESPRYRFTFEQTQEMYSLYSAGESILTISKQRGISHWTVKNAFVAYGFPLRNRREVSLLLVAQGKITGSPKRGADAPNWKGGRTYDRFGYVYIKRPEYHRANPSGYVREHIMVWEEYNQKVLPKGWHIHHINGVKDDNRIENLLAIPSKEHKLIIPELERKIKELEDEIAELKERLSLCASW